MTRLLFAHREWRLYFTGPRYVPIFHELWDGVCRYPDCGKRRYHAHEKEVGDLSAAELLSLDAVAFKWAAEELHSQDPVTYCEIDSARMELLRERDEDDGKATDERGLRIVAWNGGTDGTSIEHSYGDTRHS